MTIIHVLPIEMIPFVKSTKDLVIGTYMCFYRSMVQMTVKSYLIIRNESSKKHLIVYKVQHAY